MSIKKWPIGEQPREKLLLKGAEALTDTELLAILLRTGIKGMGAVELARKLLSHFGSLTAIFNAENPEICQIKGLGIATYAQFAVVKEIAKRILSEDLNQQTIFTDSKQVADYLRLHLAHQPIETCVIMLLNQ